ncbi:hypothetical protein EP331_09595 [bacterium]|nr:MAG: hypothetical protein EP331_09595 [bacterium]
MLVVFSVSLMSCVSKTEKIKTDYPTLSASDSLQTKIPNQGEIKFKALVQSIENNTLTVQILEIIEKGRGSVDFKTQETVSFSIDSIKNQELKKLALQVHAKQLVVLTCKTLPEKMGETTQKSIINNIEINDK